MVDPVATSMDSLWWDRPYTLAGVDIGANVATLHLLTSYGARQDIDLRTGDDTFVSRFVVTTEKPKIESWQDVDTALSRTGARYSWQVSKVDDGRCEKVAGTNTSESLPLASIFKTYVLYAVESAVTAGTLNWDDKLTITAEGKKLGSSGFDKLPPGSQITVREAAGKMIATSDNMATDLLIGRVGTHAIEEALVAAGHHDPASMTPFPTMRELFAIGWGNPDVREQWKTAAIPQDRANLLHEADSRPYDPDPYRTHAPGSAYGAEWYGNAEDICRVHAGLQHNAVGRGGPGQGRHVRNRGHRPRPHRVALHRRQGGQPSRRPDVQLVRRRPHGPGVGGQLPAQLAALPQPERRRLGDDDHQAGLRPTAPLPLTAASTPFRESAGWCGWPAQYRCARTTSAAHPARSESPHGSPRDG